MNINGEKIIPYCESGLKLQGSMLKAKTPHPELLAFKKELERAQNGPMQTPYTAYKESTLTYKLIFAALSFLFLSLEYQLLTHSPSWSATVIFGSIGAILGILQALCISLFLASGAIALFLKAEKEAVKDLSRWVKKKLFKTYKKEKLHQNLHSFFFIGEVFRKKGLFYHHYLDSLHLIEKEEREILHLFFQIRQAKGLKPTEKEKLYNQSILEVKEKFEKILADYQKAHPLFS
jgi:hypothetical protein